MTSAMLGELSPDEIEMVLRSQQTGRIGVTDGSKVYIFPVSYGYDGESIAIVSRPGLKLRLMRTHADVCFEVEAIETPARWRTVMAHGRFEEVGAAEREAALAVIAAQGQIYAPPSLAPYLDGPEAMVVYRIRLEEKTGRFENNELFHPRAAGTPR
jgi:nitroimidazol reductase NimA-like FMN-containing flavoprotein (pyridoxamine 5'-phosphate oxidase superfamily)